MHTLPAFKVLAAVILGGALAGCGSTIVTRSSPPERLGPVPRLVVVGATVKREPAALKGADLARAMVAWAGNDASRLERAADIVLRQATNPPIAGSPEKEGYALVAARLAWRSLVESGVPAARWPQERTQALRLYNLALVELVGEPSGAFAAGRPRTVSTPVGEVTLAVDFSRAGPYRAGYFDRLVPAERIEVRGFRERARTGNFGIALVGERDRTPERDEEMRFQPPGTGIYAALGGFLRFERDRAIFQVVDSTRIDDAVVGESAIALSADFAAPYAVAFNGINDLLLGIRGLLNVGFGEDDAGVYLTEPFDPERIPVLLIHGLSSSPLVWRNLATGAYLDPEIRAHCQFWYAYYPTGAPIVQSAAWIRDSLAAIRERYDPRAVSVPSRNLSIVGYSMGGIIAQILSTDIGDRLWRQVSTRPFDTLALDPDDLSELESWIFWRAVPGVRQVIFIATPHRGTAMADASFAHLGSRLVRLPGDLLQFQMRVFSALGDVFDGDLPRMQAMNGINSLSSQSPLYAALAGAPFAPGVTTHSIIGDRGRGDSPHSTDGVVSYESSHLPGAVSEVIVPTGHDAQAHPKAEAEVRRILREQIEAMGSGFFPSRAVVISE